MPPFELKSQKKSFLISLTLFFHILFFISLTSITFAKELKIKNNYKEITKDKLLKELSKYEFEENGFVEGYIIEGDDIIQIIKETDIAIKIKNSIIMGSLEFWGKLEKLPLHNDIFQRDWDQKTWHELIEKRRYYRLYDEDFGIDRITLVKNRIVIENTVIKSKKSITIDAKNTIFYAGIILKNVAIDGEINCEQAIFNREVIISDSTFNGSAEFSGSFFRDTAGFSTCIFNYDADFNLTTFNGPALFVDTTVFNDSADFKSCFFVNIAEFLSVAFKKGAEFSYATFSMHSAFRGCVFIKNGDFEYAKFQDISDFSNTLFEGEALFSHVVFDNFVSFRESKFSILLIQSVIFKENVDFRNTSMERIDFNCIERPGFVDGRLDFSNSIISEAHFQNIMFEKAVDFTDVQFGIHSNRINPITEISPDDDDEHGIVFRLVTFSGDVFFIRVKFFFDTTFERVKFIEDANFVDSVFLSRKENVEQKFCLSFVDFNKLFLKWNQFPNLKYWVNNRERDINTFVDSNSAQKERYIIGVAKSRENENLEPLSSVLNNLETIFRRQGALSDANQTYYYRKRAELNEIQNSSNFWLILQKEVEWFFWGMLCGYGTKIWWVLGWSILSIIFFAVLYFTNGDLKRNTHPKTKQDLIFKQRFLDFPNLYLTDSSGMAFTHEVVKKFINALRFSTVVLFKVGYRDTTISGKIFGIHYKYIVWIEWAVGYYLLAALAITLSNTLPVLNKLVSNIF